MPPAHGHTDLSLLANYIIFGRAPVCSDAGGGTILEMPDMTQGRIENVIQL